VPNTHAEGEAFVARVVSLALASDPAFIAWDVSLKARAINPGTSADLCVAAAWVDALLSL